METTRTAISELSSEAFRTDQAQQTHKTQLQIGSYADSLNSPYTEDDIPDLIRQVRREKAAEQVGSSR